MTKSLLTALIFSSLCPLLPAETPAEEVARLQKEVATLRIALGESRNEVVVPNVAAVEVKMTRDAAIQRINEANAVARQWRARAITLQRELSYTKAVLAENGVTLPGPSEEVVLLPKFRGGDIETRPSVVATSDVVLRPTYAALQ